MQVLQHYYWLVASMPCLGDLVGLLHGTYEDSTAGWAADGPSALRQASFLAAAIKCMQMPADCWTLLLHTPLLLITIVLQHLQRS
jgi:hypothetical protein